MNRVITISRQFGSGGHTIGKMVAQKLGIPCYDSEIIDKLSEDSGYARAYIEEYGEYATNRGWLTGAFIPRDINGHSIQDELWIAQVKLIRELAEKGPCVIIGRCSDYILRESADTLNVFVHADMDFRAKRIVEMYGEGAETPEKRIKDKDKKRGAYYSFYTDRKWGIAENYDLCLDSGRIGMEKCADIIASLY